MKRYALLLAALGFSASASADLYVTFAGRSDQNPDAVGTISLSCTYSSTTSSSCSKPSDFSWDTISNTFNYILNFASDPPPARLLYIEPLLNNNDPVIPVANTTTLPVLSTWAPVVSNNGGTLTMAYTEVGTNKIRVANLINPSNASGSGNFQWVLDFKSSSRPALQLYGGDLYMAFKGQGSNLYFARGSANGTSWSPYIQFPDVETSIAPTLVVFKNKLYIFYRGNSTKKMYYQYLVSGNTWSGEKRISDDEETTHWPSPVVFNGKLYVAFKGGSSEHLYLMSTSDGITWTSAEMPDDNWKSDSAPAIGVYGNQLYYVFRGTGTLQIQYSKSSDSLTWTTPVHRTGAYSGGSPMLLNY